MTEKNSSIRRKEEKFSISEALRKREKYLEKLFLLREYPRKNACRCEKSDYGQGK